MQKETVLAYFDRSRPTHVFVDALPVEVGAILAQRQVDGSMRPVSFASRSLSQIEREALAIKLAVSGSDTIF